MTHAGRTTQRTADTTTTTHKLMYVAAAVVAILGLVYLPKWMHSTYQYALGQATGESASDTPIAGGEGPRPPDKLNSLARSLTDAALQQYAAAQQPQLRRTQRLVHVTTALANVRAARKLVDTFATSEQMQASVGYDLDEFAVLLEHALQHTLQQQQQQQPSRTP